MPRSAEVKVKPSVSLPQQTAVLSFSRRPQVKPSPTLIAENRSPSGGEACPSSFMPQQTAVAIGPEAARVLMPKSQAGTDSGKLLDFGR